jgi:hypothetical protein
MDELSKLPNGSQEAKAKEARLKELEKRITALPSKKEALDTLIKGYQADPVITYCMRSIALAFTYRDFVDEQLKYITNIGKRIRTYEDGSAKPNIMNIDILRSLSANNMRMSEWAKNAEHNAFTTLDREGREILRATGFPEPVLEEQNKQLHEIAAATLNAIHIRLNQILDIDYEHFAELDKTSKNPLRPQTQPPPPPM